MTIQYIITRKEDQTFDCKSIQIDPKALAITIVAFANTNRSTIRILQYQLYSTLLVHIEKVKTLVNQRFTRVLQYPDSGSNRDGLLHWCLRPARLPIPPSGHLNANVVANVQRNSEITKNRRRKVNSIGILIILLKYKHYVYFLLYI